jgi:(E)-4-hydroxy-3-methylbut-2-enyl-diphosphate synthase
LIGLAGEVEKRLVGIDRDITVAVMGCIVNGPGEAREADYGIAGGKGNGILFKKGEIIRRVPEENLCDALIDMILKDV